MAKVLGIKQVFDFNYVNHSMDDLSRVEMRARLIFLIRLLKIDTILTYDPWGHYEENPDHYVTAQCVEAACWMAAGHLDFPEHFAAGLQPHRVREKYYYARGPQLVNRVVDISTTIDRKMEAIRANRTMIGNMVRELREELAKRRLKLPELEGEAGARSARSPICVSATASPRAASSTGSPMRNNSTTSGPIRRSTSTVRSTPCRCGRRYALAVICQPQTLPSWSAVASRTLSGCRSSRGPSRAA